MNTEERIAIALESIAKSLSTLAEYTKASRELFSELENKINDLVENPFGIKEKEERK